MYTIELSPFFWTDFVSSLAYILVSDYLSLLAWILSWSVVLSGNNLTWNKLDGYIWYGSCVGLTPNFDGFLSFENERDLARGFIIIQI